MVLSAWKNGEAPGEDAQTVRLPEVFTEAQTCRQLKDISSLLFHAVRKRDSRRSVRYVGDEESTDETDQRRHRIF